MTDNGNLQPEPVTPIEQPELPAPITYPNNLDAQQKKIIIAVVAGVIIILASMLAFLVFLAQPTTDTAKIRDIFIIFMAFESLIIGFVLVLLIIQMARLINLLQNDIMPILNSTNDTVNNLRGTTSFLSNNLTEPVIKLNEYLAGFTEFFRLVGFVRRPPKN